MKHLLRKRSVGLQLKLGMLCCLTIAFAVIASLVYHNAQQALLTQTYQEQQSKLDAIATTVAGQYDAYVSTTKVLNSTLRNGYLAGLEVSTDSVDYAGRSIRNIEQYGLPLVNNHDIFDTFTADTGAIGQLYSRSGSEWVAIAGSSKATSSSDTESVLGQSFAGYSNLTAGQPFVAQETHAGQAFLVYYQPLLDGQKQPAGVLSVALSVEKATQQILASLQEIHWGKTGDTLVVDRNKATHGEFLLGSLSGATTFFQFVDADGHQPFATLADSSRGLLTIETKHGQSVEQRFVIYTAVKGWNWLLVGGTWMNEVTQQSRDLLWLIIGFAVTVGIATYGVMTWLIQRLLGPLRTITQYMHRLEQGEVSVVIPREADAGNNEMTQLSNSVSQMAERLAGLVEQIRKSSVAVETQSTDVAQDAKRNLMQSHEQQQQVEQVVTAIEEMATSADSVAQQVDTIVASVVEANQDINAGSQLVGSVSAAMEQLHHQLEQTYQAITVVDSNSHQIQQVTTMISEIAEQTNLLALNAAIEAARAGEQGRGFAVVADEVRTLAHRTQTSVKNVEQIITTLRHSTQETVKLTQQSQQQADDVYHQSKQAGETLRAIASQVNTITDQTQAIAATVEEQANVSQLVASNASDINDLNLKNQKTSQQTVQSAQSLQQEAHQLQSQVAYFR
ncbi:methyl-accepting chemotaxis protein [Vibrio porteresiae]|nr:methyl-accepting chemotaxis protein [Vibrio porteresiae]